MRPTTYIVPAGSVNWSSARSGKKCWPRYVGFEVEKVCACDDGGRIEALFGKLEPWRLIRGAGNFVYGTERVCRVFFGPLKCKNRAPCFFTSPPRAPRFKLSPRTNFNIF